MTTYTPQPVDWRRPAVTVSTTTYRHPTSSAPEATSTITYRHAGTVR